MDRRAIFGIALSILVLIGYQMLVTWYYGPPPAPAPVADRTGEEKTAPSVPKPAPPPAQALPDERVASEKGPTTVAAKDVTVETDNYVAVFTTRGARLKSFRFKKFRSAVDENSLPFDIVQHAPGVPLPLGLRWQAPEPFDDSSITYSLRGDDLKISGDAKGSLVFQGQSPGGIAVTKSLTFSGRSYSVDFTVSTKATDGGSPVPAIVFTDKSDHSVPDHGAPFEGLIAVVDNKIHREHATEAANIHSASALGSGTPATAPPPEIGPDWPLILGASAFLLPLQALLPWLAFVEEEIFRAGLERVSTARLLRASLFFGLAHMIMLVLLGAALGLAVAGLAYGLVYRRGYLDAASRPAPVVARRAFRPTRRAIAASVGVAPARGGVSGDRAGDGSASEEPAGALTIAATARQRQAAGVFQAAVLHTTCNSLLVLLIWVSFVLAGLLA